MFICTYFIIIPTQFLQSRLKKLSTLFFEISVGNNQNDEIFFLRVIKISQ